MAWVGCEGIGVEEGLVERIRRCLETEGVEKMREGGRRAQRVRMLIVELIIDLCSVMLTRNM